MKNIFFALLILPLTSFADNFEVVHGDYQIELCTNRLPSQKKQLNFCAFDYLSLSKSSEAPDTTYFKFSADSKSFNKIEPLSFGVNIPKDTSYASYSEDLLPTSASLSFDGNDGDSSLINIVQISSDRYRLTMKTDYSVGMKYHFDMILRKK